ncbi:MAG TPA: 5-formyltetrahydrofolate cyclo-ligase [Lachnospiraceae bacterium]|nr:5-formyltetrahydrofolate cyclo-ligase [Lachnospiraceae bacterium]
MQETKNELRERICQFRSAMPIEECSRKSRMICETIIKSSDYQNADTVYLYMAFRNEVYLFEVMQSAFRDGKQVAVPKIHKDGVMRFHLLQADNVEKMTEKGYFGIEEPLRADIEAPAPDMVLMPGIAFDRQGNRIGYGKGFYDTYLHSLHEAANQVIKIGVAYECQLVTDIPAQEHDFRVDKVVTELGMQDCNTEESHE